MNKRIQTSETERRIMQRDGVTVEPSEYAKRMDALRAENARLREVLKEIRRAAGERYSASRLGLKATDENLNHIEHAAIVALEATQPA